MSEKPGEDVLRELEGERAVFGVAGKVVAGLAILWSLLQLWYASPLPFLTANIIPVQNDTDARSLHLAFGMLLAFLCYPAVKGKGGHAIPLYDWVLAGLGAFAAGYLFLFNDALAERPGLPTTLDLVVAGAGLLLLLEAARRALGLPIVIVALVFIAYVFFGDMAPDIVSWRGASFSRAMSHLWLGTEGVFGIAIGVSTSVIFLFVLFGALLEKGGAGDYFIRLAFSLVGHMRGGPAKAAVLASGMTGLVSGSSIANTVTTGTFTIPLMRRAGFSKEQAGAVEVAASVNGQIMPPVMGAAAFLMVEYVGISYVEVIKHAFLPAVISYIALVYLVHLEAAKANAPLLERADPMPAWHARLLRAGLAWTGITLFLGGAYYLIEFVRAVAGSAALPLLLGGLFVLYVGAIFVAARQRSDETASDFGKEGVPLPRFAETVGQGLHFLLPVALLVWCLVVERLSPGLSAFWAVMALLFILATQKLLIALLSGKGARPALLSEAQVILSGLEAGARNMIVIAVATAAAGIIVGTVSLTGIGLMLTDLVQLLSGGSLILMLLYVAVLCLVLGLGLPTTANYIVVSSLLAGVIVQLGAESGLVVPLIAVHLFVFYFGIMADVTPPVGLASFAAAAVSGGDPIRTGVTAFRYSLRTVILPFFFIFNTKLLLIGVEGPFDLLLTVLGALVGVLLFAAITQGWMLTRLKLWEGAVLLAAAFTLLRPGYFVDQVMPPVAEVSYEDARDYIAAAEEGGHVALIVEGVTFEGDEVRRTVRLPLGEPGTAAERLSAAGLELREEEGRVLVSSVRFGSPAGEAGISFDWEVLGAKLPQEQVSAYWLYVPAFALVALVVMTQRRRVR
ncbi:TRAP transporter permease [Tepidicaulis sp. LMO-SS28]|uniref:TRAP transporter permease n=1 Tax=Tepidicaulis sp. LMO-SS28 TaxID=3447455 RepID=UPI003EE24520